MKHYFGSCLIDHHRWSMIAEKSKAWYTPLTRLSPPLNSLVVLFVVLILTVKTVIIVGLLVLVKVIVVLYIVVVVVVIATVAAGRYGICSKSIK